MPKKKTSFSQFEVKKKPKPKGRTVQPNQSNEGIFERERAKLAAQKKKAKPKASTPKKRKTTKSNLVNKAEREAMKRL